MQPIIDTGYGAKGLILWGERALLLRKPNGEYDLPGGRLEVGELDRDGLDREIQEETGLRKVRITTLYSLWTFINRSGAVIKGRTWLCWHSVGEVRLSGEHSGSIWVPLNQLRGMDIYWKFGLDKVKFDSIENSLERREAYAF